MRRTEWDRAVQIGRYAPESLAIEGFIHCSTIEQVSGTANRYYRGQRDLVLLRIDEALLNSPLKYERPDRGGGYREEMYFPHIYGPLNLGAVTEVIDFPCEVDGTFVPPRSHE